MAGCGAEDVTSPSIGGGPLHPVTNQALGEDRGSARPMRCLEGTRRTSVALLTSKQSPSRLLIGVVIIAPRPGEPPVVVVESNMRSDVLLFYIEALKSQKGKNPLS